jgi:transcriptional regulator with XRE-family HTH domain
MLAVDLKLPLIVREYGGNGGANVSCWDRVILAERLRAIREDLYGEQGGQFLADDLGIPLRTWLNYECGVAMPAHDVLQLIVLVGINPNWLLTGQGEKYDRSRRYDQAGNGVSELGPWRQGRAFG